jgi:hypothetical protein
MILSREVLGPLGGECRMAERDRRVWEPLKITYLGNVRELVRGVSGTHKDGNCNNHSQHEKTGMPC